MKRSYAQKTVCHVKIKSSEAVKSGIAVKITFAWEGRLGTPQLPILFKDNAWCRSKEHGGYCGSYKSPPKP